MFPSQLFCNLFFLLFHAPINPLNFKKSKHHCVFQNSQTKTDSKFVLVAVLRAEARKLILLQCSFCRSDTYSSRHIKSEEEVRFFPGDVRSRYQDRDTNTWNAFLQFSPTLKIYRSDEEIWKIKGLIFSILSLHCKIHSTAFNTKFNLQRKLVDFIWQSAVS